MKPKLREAYEETLQVLFGVNDIMLHHCLCWFFEVGQGKALFAH